MSFHFELPARGKNTEVEYLIRVSSRKAAETSKNDPNKGILNITFSKDAKYIIDAIGDRVAIAFDDEKKVIALKRDSSGWKITNDGTKTLNKRLQVTRYDFWGKIKNVYLTSASVTIIDDIVIINVGNMK